MEEIKPLRTKNSDFEHSGSSKLLALSGIFGQSHYWAQKRNGKVLIEYSSANMNFLIETLMAEKKLAVIQNHKLEHRHEPIL